LALEVQRELFPQEHVFGRQVRPRPQAQPNERGNVEY
jgi:hypothetical protein